MPSQYDLGSLLTFYCKGIIWLDIGSDLDIGPNRTLLNFLQDEQTASQLCPTIRHKPERTWTDDTVHGEFLGYTKVTPCLPGAFVQSASLLHSNYGSMLTPTLACTDAFYAFSEIFDFAAHSESQFLNMLESKIQKEMVQMDVLDQVAPVPSLSNLVHHKRVLDRHIQRITDNVSMIQNRGKLTTETTLESDWPQAKEPADRRQVRLSALTLLRDFQYLLARAESLSLECDRGMNVLMNTAMIVESKKAIEQAEGVAKLTRLAFFFVPLSFAASFFGMNFQELGGTGNLEIWAFVVMTVVLFTITLFLLFCDIPGQVVRCWRSVVN